MKSKTQSSAVASQPKKTWLPNFVRVICSLAVMGLLFFTGLAVVNHFHHKQNPKDAKDSQKPAASASEVEKIGKATNASLLQEGNYQAYLSNQESLATQYRETKDYKNAERVMEEVMADVPPDQLDITAYAFMAAIQRDLGKTEQYKHYLGLLIDYKKSHGDIEGAAASQQVLDGIK